VKNLRTFVAVEVSNAARRYAQSLMGELESKLTGVHWTRRDNLHLTLKFLGDIPESEINGVCRAIRAAVAAQQPFEIQCAGLGAFPSDARPRTLWVGIRQGDERLRQLQGEIDGQLTSYGFAPERRRFHGHLTIGRIRQRIGLTADQVNQVCQLVDRERSAEGVFMELDQVVTFSSFVDSTGRVYQPIDHAELGTS
jgi:2'-5' RNA ligase